MGAVYVISEYGKLSKNGGHLVFSNKDGSSRPVLMHQTRLLVVGSHVSITGEAMGELFKNTIPVLFMGKGGHFNASIQYDAAKNVNIRHSQYRLMDDEQKSLSMARQIVCGKIKNQLAYMHRIARRKCPSGQADEPIDAVKLLLEQAEKCTDLNALRGIEGMAAKHYFSVLRFNISPEWAEFPCRSKHPPKTNVNAVLSFLYALLACRVQCAIEAEGLDSMAGTLHSTQYGRPSLVCDLMEEFRSCIADSTCCTLFNKGMLSVQDFCEKDLNGAVYMTEEGRFKIINAFEDKLRTVISCENFEGTYEQLIFEQAYIYRQAVENELAYVPFACK